MKKTSYCFVISTVFMLTSCTNTTKYNEAELIRKIDELQFTVSNLSQQVAELEKKQAVTTAPVTSTTAPTTTTTIVTTTKKPVPSKVTTRPLPPVTTATTKSIFHDDEFEIQFESYKKQITTLSHSIATTVPHEIETDRIDQFYQYQSNVIVISEELNQYQLLMKDAYDVEVLTQDEYIKKERQLKILNDALIKLENQLEFKFGMEES